MAAIGIECLSSGGEVPTNEIGICLRLESLNKQRAHHTLEGCRRPKVVSITHVQAATSVTKNTMPRKQNSKGACQIGNYHVDRATFRT